MAWLLSYIMNIPVSSMIKNPNTIPKEILCTVSFVIWKSLLSLFFFSANMNRALIRNPEIIDIAVNIYSEIFLHLQVYDRKRDIRVHIVNIATISLTDFFPVWLL